MIRNWISTAALVALGFMSVGCNSDSDEAVAEVKSIAFSPVEIAANDTEKQEMRVSNNLSVTYSDDR